MAVQPILRLSLRHDYYAPYPPPLNAAPSDPDAFRRDGLFLRQTADDILIARETDRGDLTDLVSLDLVPGKPTVGMLTEGMIWDRVPVVPVPAGSDDLSFADAIRASKPRPSGDTRIARLDIAPTAGEPREITLRFGAISALWTYHVSGADHRDGLQILDPEDGVRFEDLGRVPLLPGRSARVLRSVQPVQMRARPPQRFTLQYGGPFGPVVLVPVLPAAGLNFRTLPDGAPTRLQADIYVTLN